jgi:rhombotail lipoprotein
VVQYLYPDKKAPAERAAIPFLSLPIKAGIAFVPEASDKIKNLSEKK